MPFQDFLITIPAFLFALGVIVFVHELGHFLVAKLFGVRVLVFSLGFGKRLWGFRFKGTDCRVSAVPLGGYVQMWGELPEDRTGHPDEFPAKPRWQRILVYLAGPAMNVVLSVGLFTGLFAVGIQEQAFQEIPSVIGLVRDGSAGERAGLAAGDRIETVDGNAVDRWDDLAFALTLAPDREVTLAVVRGDERFETVIVPDVVERYGHGDAGIAPAGAPTVVITRVVADSPADQAGLQPGDEVQSMDGREISLLNAFVAYVEPRAETPIEMRVLRGDEFVTTSVVPALQDDVGRIGVEIGSYQKIPFRPLPLDEAFVESVRYNIEIVERSVQVLGKLFAREIAAKSALSGPIEIAAWTGRAAKRSFKDLLTLMGLLSISIGFMNLLPIPVLDGGHITILLVESTMRRDLSTVLKERITQAGFMILLMLMVVVIFFDLSKNLPGLMPGP